MIKDQLPSGVPAHTLIRKRLLPALLLILLTQPFLLRAQGYTTVALTGFNADVIADGPSLAASVTADVDGTGYYFLNGSFTQFGNPTYYLPTSGLLSSVTTPGLTYQLAAAAGPNSLRLATATVTSGSLNFTTPQKAATVYVLATSGTAPSTVDITVNFTDGSTQLFTGQTIADWYNGTPIAVQGIGRTSATALDGTSTNPRLYQLALNLNVANYTKLVSGITVNRTSSTGFTQVMGLSISTPCAAPAAQPTGLTLTAVSPSQINSSFTAAVPAADQYLVVRYPAGATPTAPVNGVAYTANAALGTGTVVQAAAGSTFSATGLQPVTAYDFYIYAYNSTNCVGPIYASPAPLSGAATTTACAGPSGIIPVGPTGTYPTLTAALTALNSGIGGPVVLELQAAYTSGSETFPITINANACVTAINTLVIRPEAGAAGLQISSSNAGPSIDFAGARYVSIDGRPGGTGTSGQLSVINSATNGAAIRIYNDASSDTLAYLDLQGRNTSNTSSALSGVVYIGAAGTAGNGNDNNVITHCNIHAATGGTPAIGISAYGSNGTVAAYNDNIVLEANNIYDFFLANGPSTALKVDQGNNAWTISGNSIYQTASRTYTTTAATHRAFWITPNVASIANTAGGFVITNNYIGGSAPAAGGGAYTMTGTIATIFNGMDISVGLGTATSIQNNVISNIALTTTSTGNSFIGIGTANGVINIGTSAGNTIGSATTAGRITVTPVTSSGGTVWGIRIGGGSTITVSNNKVGGITVAGAGTISGNFIGIGTGGGTTTNVTGNTIGGFAGSIQLGASSATTAQSATGISIVNGTTTLVDGNTISYISNNYTGTGTGTTRGIVLSTSGSVISNNTIRNLTSTSPTASGGATSVLTGIAMTSTAGVDVTGNTIHSLTLASASTTAAANITGIFYQGGAVQSKVQRNFIHSFEFTAANTSITMTGMDYATGSLTVANNMIRLGIRPDGSSLSTPAVVRGISSNSSSSFNNIYFNTIYIGGSGVGSTVKNSYAIIRTSTSGTYDIRNNILVNERSNASTGGKHYTLYFTTATTGAAPDYNIYRYPGSGAVFAYNGTTDVAAYTSGWVASDIHSLAANPVFVNATGDTASVNLHLVPGQNAALNDKGVAIASVTTDFDGDVRNAATPDIGADEFDVPVVDVAALSLVTPVVSNCYSGAETISVRIRNNATATLNFATTPVTVKVDVTGAATASFSQTISSGSLAPGDSLLITFTPTLDMTTVGTYSFTVIALSPLDINNANDTLTAVQRITAALNAGTIAVTPAVICNSGTPTLTLSGNTGGNVQWQEGSSIGGPWINVGAGNSSYTPAVAITATTYYRALVGCNGNTATTAVDSAQVSTPLVVSTVPATRCGPGTVTLSAIGSAGTTLNWYTAATGGTAIGTGASFTTPSISASTIYFVEAAATAPSGCLSPRVAVSAGVNQLTAISASPVDQAVCPGSNAVLSVTANGSGLSYQWKKGTAVIAGATSATLTLSNVAAADAGSYSVEVTGTCGTVTSAPATLSISAANSWTGAVSSDWNNSANWCGGIPSNTSDISIAAGTPFSPVISSSADVHSLSISTGATVSFSAAGQLNIYGNYSNAGTLDAPSGTIVFRGATQQTVSALAAANIIVNSTGGIVLAGNMTAGSLQLQLGNITLGSNDLFLGGSSTGALPSHIISNAAGSVVATVASTAVTIPVGPDAASYNPVTLSNGQGISYRVSVATGINPALNDNSKAVNRSWKITPATAPAAPVTVTFQYDNAQGNAGFQPTGPLEVGYYSGAQWLLVSPSGGLIPTGATGARQVSLSTSSLGTMVVASPGAIGYLTAVSSLGAEVTTIRLLPNPVHGHAVLRLEVPRAKDVQLGIRDAGGRLLRSSGKRLAAGINNIQLDFSEYPAAVYFIEVSNGQGKPAIIALVKE
jgi:hypothetical protein